MTILVEYLKRLSVSFEPMPVGIVVKPNIYTFLQSQLPNNDKLPTLCYANLFDKPDQKQDIIVFYNSDLLKRYLENSIREEDLKNESNTVA